MGAGRRKRCSGVRRAAQARSLVSQAARVDQPPTPPRSFQPAASATAVASSIFARNCSEGARRCRGAYRAVPSGAEACSASAVPVQCQCSACAERRCGEVQRGWRGVRRCLVQVVERDVEQLLRVAAGNQLVLEPHRHEVKELRQETRCGGAQRVAGRSVRGGRVGGG